MRNNDNFKDYYEILGIEFGSSSEKIKSAFRQLAKKYHPDVSKEDKKDFKMIIEAYKVLSNPTLKETYDKEYLSRKKINSVTNHNYKNIIDQNRIEYKTSLVNISRAGFDLSKKFSREDILEELGEDLVVYLIDQEIHEGATLTIKLPAKAVCNVCYGSNRNCYRCDGTGYMTVMEEIKIQIPPNTKHLETINIDLTKMKRKGISKFALKDLKIRIKWLSLIDT
ncbi:MAG: DnaJ domain-containing protein [Brevinematia bacterium]